MRKAVIAVGSNSTRLLVADCAARKRPEEVFRARKSTRLLLCVENGVITPGGIEHVARDVEALCREARERGAETVDLIATSATRDAENRDALAERIRRETGLVLRVLSGEEEAYFAYLAVAEGESGVVVDIGGGSTEITVGERGDVVLSESARVGSSRLLMAFGEIRTLEDALTVRDAARERLRALTDKAGAARGGALYGIGGTCVAAAKIWTRDAVAEGVRLPRGEIERQLRLIAPMSLDERACLPGLPASRASHMPHGLCILLAVMEAMDAGTIAVSERTNMDGWLLESGGNV